MEYSFSSIGSLRTPWTEKFGVPRQSLMISEAWGVLKMNKHPQYRTALSQLDTFSHIWLVFVFHKNKVNKWRPIIEPPRLDVRDVGVFASRSPRRPNPIGLSAVKLERIDYEPRDGIEIHLSGVDLLNETPILDIKPYLPFADCLPDASSGWAHAQIKSYPVGFSEQALATIEEVSKAQYPRLLQLIEQMLAWDPRPTSQKKVDPLDAPQTLGKSYAFRLHEFDIHWLVRDNLLFVTEVKRIAT